MRNVVRVIADVVGATGGVPPATAVPTRAAARKARPAEDHCYVDNATALVADLF
ncbi:hypothetical protein [Streptomyces chartreusis]